MLFKRIAKDVCGTDSFGAHASSLCRPYPSYKLDPALQALPYPPSTTTTTYLPIQVEEQMPSIQEVQYQVQLARSLEAVAQGNNVRVQHRSQQVTLCLDVVSMLLLEDALLAHDLHGIHLAGTTLAHLEHLAATVAMTYYYYYYHCYYYCYYYCVAFQSLHQKWSHVAGAARPKSCAVMYLISKIALSSSCARGTLHIRHTMKRNWVLHAQVNQT